MLPRTRKTDQDGPAAWSALGFYEKFEQAIALALGTVIALIIVFSLLQLMRAVYGMLLLGAFNPLDHEVFQTLSG